MMGNVHLLILFEKITGEGGIAGCRPHSPLPNPSPMLGEGIRGQGLIIGCENGTPSTCIVKSFFRYPFEWMESHFHIQ